MRASTASWRSRFSWLMIDSGALISTMRRSRLLRLMMRRYRSLRSEVANRPPSSWTIGLNSGGSTGMASRIIHSGRFCDLRKASTILRRLIARARRAPLRSSISLRSFVAKLIEVDLLEQLEQRVGPEARVEDALELVAQVLRADIDERVERAVLDLADEALGLKARRGPRRPCPAPRTAPGRLRSRPGSGWPALPRSRAWAE